jgi:hypothetical protein
MCESSLENLTPVFKANFQLFDIALSDSLITRSNFLLPAKCARKDPAIRATVPRISRSPAPTADLPPESGPPDPPVLFQQANRVTEIPESTPQASESQFPISPADLPSADPLAIAHRLPLTLESLNCPVPRGSYVSVDIRFSGKGWQPQVFDAAASSPLLVGSRDGKIGCFNIHVTSAIDRKTVFATIRSNLVHSTFIARAQISEAPMEIVAIRFKLAQKNTMTRKRFSTYIPRAGATSPAGDCPYLFKHKDIAVKLSEKPPLMKGGIPVLYFGGRVKSSCAKNHILTDEGGHADAMVFGKASNGHYIAEVLPPLSPLQAVCLSFVHLR